MCHAGWEGRRVNRIERHRDRVSLRDALKTWGGGDDLAFHDLSRPSCRRFW
jgi:hypothetical protein